MGPLGLLGYRARPVGNNPDQCIFDVYSLQRYPEGKEPVVEHQWTNDLTDKDFWGLVLSQDYENVEQVQKGMKSKGFKGAKPNPKQEVPVLNFHRALRAFIDKGYAGQD